MYLSRLFFTTALFSSLFFAVAVPTYAVDLSKPPAGDGVCGFPSPCSLTTDLPNLIKYIQIAGITIVGIIGFASIFFLGAKVLVSKNQPQEAAAAKAAIQDKVTWLIIGFVLIAGLLFTAISTFTTSPIKNFFNPYLYSSIPSSFGIATAYAADSQHLTNYLVVDTPYDVLILFFQFAMRWVGIPVIIYAWIKSGFLFVAAQGSPEKIKEAKDSLLKTAIWTIILMFALALTFAFRDTVNQIFK